MKKPTRCHIGLVIAVFAAVASISCGRAAAREVTLVARGMTFALPDRPDAVNPVLRLRAGERVRLVLRNEAAGLIHDVAIPAWGVATEAVPSGQTTETTFVVPDGSGPVEYQCRPHAAMMTGRIDVGS
jgi:plastocyanin